MAWFKVDDGFYDHPKVSTLPNAAVGLWVKAGSWCGRYETDGVIPATQVRALKGTSSQVSALIRSGLWVQIETDSGAKAYAFRDWNDYQPTREQREKEREEWAEKKRKQRERKEAYQHGRGNVPQGLPEMSPQMSPRGTSRGLPEMSGTPRARYPDPTRPDPSLNGGYGSQPANGSTARDGGAGLPDHIPGQLRGAVARAQQRGVSNTAIAAAIAAWESRPGSKTGGLFRPLLDDAIATEAEQHRARQADAEKQALLAARRNCELCDVNGMLRIGGVLTRCPHDADEVERMRAIADHEDHQPAPRPKPNPHIAAWRRRTRIVDADQPLNAVDATPTDDDWPPQIAAEGG
ncbi:hypothetical protein [Corynebacterium heidelbergense]|uniref:Uncharacterized protein n=1 Tax=Corynebacterium heidelbergense TaxID=2055947 RepID=A0A364VDM4_9CORY|nr:hypothetical protein [Corynebacterium heidelbergense]RAV34740.1 hypothetical protein CWC39_01445 [Corynebacterium heidelbergense]WCZ36999.1 hypothetical protein CHEID_07330 [Corynebacterium heidelbergense]